MATGGLAITNRGRTTIFQIIVERKDSSTPWSKDEQVIASTNELWMAKLLVKDYKVAWGPWYKVYFRKKL